MYEANYYSLASAVVEPVINEYKKALKANDTFTIKRCERWFMSEWCYLLSGMDGDYIINACRKVVQDEKTNRRNDGKRTKKVYIKRDEKSKYKAKEHSKKKEDNESGSRRN